MKKWILSAIMVFQSYSAEANNVVAFADYRGLKMCHEIFRKSPENANQVEAFAEKSPPYLETRAFLGDMQNPVMSATYFFYSASTTPPLSRFDSGAWSPSPSFTHGRDIFILKAEKKWTPGKKRDWGKGSIPIRDIRSRYEVVAFTRFPVPAVFYSVYQVIYFIHGFETRQGSYYYSSPPVDYSSLLREGPQTERLKEFINSWRIDYSEEQLAKNTLLKLVEAEGHKDEINAELFKKKLTDELFFLYPEWASTIVSHL